MIKTNKNTGDFSEQEIDFENRIVSSTENPEDYELLSQDSRLSIEGVFEGMEKGEMVMTDDKGHKISLTCSFTKRQKDILKAGGLLAYTKG